MSYRTLRMLPYGALVCFLSLFPVWGQENPAQLNEDLEPDRPPYVIEPDDILEIFVWKEPDLSRKVLVRPDGRISVPLVQDLPAAGLTPVELKESIEEMLEEYIDTPSVTVIVDAIQHYKFYVTGKVQNPGLFTSVRAVSVLQALTMAGGFQDYADKSEISVVRTYGREHVVSHFNYGEVIKGKKTHQNLILRSGDVVVVP